MLATQAPASRPSYDLYEVVNNKLRIELHPGQTRAWESKRRFVWVIAGTQSGKTSFVPIWLDREIKIRGRGDFLAVTATFDMFKLKFFPEMEHYFKHLWGWKYSASERVLWRKDAPRLFTRIILRSADSEAGLESATAKGAVLDECGLYKVTAWEAVQRRLALNEGRVLGATTPYNLGWLYSMVYQPWTKGDPESAVIQFKSIQNPSFPRAEYYRQKAKLPGWKFRMFYDGEFTRPAGLIYGDFDELHIIPPRELPERWPRFLGIDFGGVNTAKIYLAMDPANGFLYAYREELSGNKTSKEHVEEVQKHEEPIARVWGGSKSESQQRRDFAGLQVEEPPISDVESGIDKVIEILKARRFFVFSTCTGLIDEFGTYSRKLDEFGEPLEEIKDKNTFHRLDALRYVIAGLLHGEETGSNYQVSYA